MSDEESKSRAAAGPLDHASEINGVSLEANELGRRTVEEDQKGGTNNSKGQVHQMAQDSFLPTLAEGSQEGDKEG